MTHRRRGPDCGSRDGVPLNEGFEYRTRVGSDANGLDLLEYLARTYSKFSTDEWRRRIEAGRVLVDDRRAPADTVLRAGQSLVWARPPWQEPDVPLSFAILYRGAEAKLARQGRSSGTSCAGDAP